MSNKTILVTNDDGITSEGLISLRGGISSICNVVCIASEPMSATGKALTFHKPLRYKKVDFDDGTFGYHTSGTPADNVLIGLHILDRKPDLVVSGINYGDNSSVHSILSSGTCAAAFEAAFNGVPAVAFSADLADDVQLIEQGGVNFEPMVDVCRKIVKLVLEKEWPKDLAFLNVNFPVDINEDTEIHVTFPNLYKYENYMISKKDPRNLPYLWLWGERKQSFPEGSDTWAVIQKKAISITPIGFNLNEKTDQAVDLANYVQKHL